GRLSEGERGDKLDRADPWLSPRMRGGPGAALGRYSFPRTRRLTLRASALLIAQLSVAIEVELERRLGDGHLRHTGASARVIYPNLMVSYASISQPSTKPFLIWSA